MQICQYYSVLSDKHKSHFVYFFYLTHVIAIEFFIFHNISSSIFLCYIGVHI